ncbi:MAG: peptidoglycan-binding domain-containing protein [Collinsella sp.]
MEPISQGMQGPAVEDVQTRLSSLGYMIDAAEMTAKEFGATTAAAARAFRAQQGLDAGEDVDGTCWSALVDESYKLGDRTLYLRLPNFHGADVRALQRALNTLGFACGVDDGYFGPHTEAALQQFQENVGLFADGMAFQDTFNYVNRLHHVWEGKPSVIDVEAEARMGFARAASVLEAGASLIGGEDAIARNVASRVWNIATATTDGSGIVPYDDVAPEDVDLTVEIASDALPERRRAARHDHPGRSATTSHCASRPAVAAAATRPIQAPHRAHRASPATARSLQVMRKLWPFAFSTACVMR